MILYMYCVVLIQLQQYLPFTVLKQIHIVYDVTNTFKLQQYLPFTVLKRSPNLDTTFDGSTLLQQYLPFTVLKQLMCFITIQIISMSCNSTYRLRY